MVALWNRADHYIFILWFLLSIFYLFYSTNLSGRRVVVYHTSTHGVALVRIYDAGLKCAARCSLQIQDAKHHHLVVFSFFIIFFYLVPCGTLSWLLVSFWAHVNIVHRIVSYRLIRFQPT